MGNIAREDVHADAGEVTSSPVLQGLAARIADDCRVLVLGSMPGGESLRQQRYYAHPRNRFWPLMERLGGVDQQLGYEARIAALQRRGIGLWDVIGECRRAGSLDADIERDSIVANPLPQQMAALPGLRAVACNGGAAYQLWQRHIASKLEMDRPDAADTRPVVLALPSTSPANAAFSLDRLAAAWGEIVGYLDD